jgi:hypothetical protein
LERLQPIPGYSPAHHLEAEVANQAQVLAPVLVVAHELVFVQRAVTRPGLGHESVLDPGSPQEVLGTAAEEFGCHGGRK